jgi:hypothetical protein
MAAFDQPYIACKQETQIQDQCYDFGVAPHSQDEMCGAVFGHSSMFKENNIYSIVEVTSACSGGGQLSVLTSKQVC